MLVRHSWDALVRAVKVSALCPCFHYGPQSSSVKEGQRPVQQSRLVINVARTLDVRGMLQTKSNRSFPLRLQQPHRPQQTTPKRPQALTRLSRHTVPKSSQPPRPRVEDSNPSSKRAVVGELCPCSTLRAIVVTRRICPLSVVPWLPQQTVLNLQ